MSEQTLKGRRTMDSTRAPKQIEERRSCIQDGCDTTLSRYNKRDHCYAHAPTRFPRLRGRIVAET